MNSGAWCTGKSSQDVSDTAPPSRGLAWVRTVQTLDRTRPRAQPMRPRPSPAEAPEARWPPGPTVDGRRRPAARQNGSMALHPDPASHPDSFGARSVLSVNGRDYEIFDLNA